MRVHLYTFAWNEARLVPYFLRHYLPWVERVVVYDNQSTDGTQAMLAQHSPRVEVRSFVCADYPEPEPLGALRSQCWPEARGRADWVVVVDFDEFLWHPCGVPEYLSRAYRRGYTVVQTYGWQMVAESFPPEHVGLADWCRTGVPKHWYSKPVVFRPDQFDELAWEPGCHGVRAQGNLRQLASGSLALLHYKYLGLAYVQQRYAEYRARITTPGKRASLGHYQVPADKLKSQFEATLSAAVDVTL